ncbi:ATP-binding region ATPase domain protein (plasmid) [Gemmatirosa kalamazoonensis]|uniref:histidine kinase n=1 Tax=Gemmatirosa kalamazoonensis TaxID=861299 RepID=W0RR32_9BACT|nr:ATP-binding protein [Gemmatirosa kalamazoonensis]AHG93444.1 ATP-binding region ATPase domain protein [Gemmatirosa kalamazoonensis]
MPLQESPLTSLGAEALPLLSELGEVLELGILTLDCDLVVRGWNRWLAAASGAVAADVVDRPLLDVFPGLRDTPAEAALRRALVGVTTVWAHRFHRYFLPLPSPPGHHDFEHMQQSARIVPLLRDARVDGVFVLVQDVTERVAREEELRDALQRAETASRAKSEFLASMSHELRTPLSAVVGYMELLEGEMVGPVEPLQKTYLSRVKAAARHLISIIEEILTFSRVDAGKEEIHPVVVDVAPLVESVGELFVPQALQKGLALVVNQAAEGVTLGTDPTKLRQILINLLGNALKFTDAGQVTLDVEATSDRVVFRVRDTGPGIVRENLERIFDPFTQIDQSLTRVKGGTGLGLPVSRRLARLLDGDLSVESAAGQGTTFTLWLPRNVGVRAAEG